MALLTKLGLGFIGKMLIKIALAVLTALEVVIENIQNLLEGIVTTDPEIKNKLNDLFNKQLSAIKVLKNNLLKRQAKVNYIIKHTSVDQQTAAKLAAESEARAQEQREKIEAISIKDKGTEDIYALACATSGANAGGLSQVQKEANAKYIYNYLSDEGWSIQAIAGLLGNIEQESRMNPGAWEAYNQTETLRSGYGLVQWTISGEKLLKDKGETEKEKADYVNNLAKNNPKLLMDLQLEYLLLTMKPGGGEWLTGGVDKFYKKRSLDYDTPGKMTYKEFISSTHDPGDLALVFHALYERSGDDKNILDARVQYANNWYVFLATQ